MHRAFKICILLNLFFSSGFISSLPKKKALVIDFMSEDHFIHTKKDMNCDSDLFKLYCRIKCEEKRKSLGICLEGNCYCVVDDEPELVPLSKPKRLIAKKGKRQKKFAKDTQNENPVYLPVDLLKKPLLRHQVVHFCPNLDIARKCIRKCVAEGKPGFCGKDHVCYCGHKYEDTKFPDAPKVLAKFKNFRDFYEMYYPEYYNKKHNKSMSEKHDEDNTIVGGIFNNHYKKVVEKANANKKAPHDTPREDAIIEDVPDNK